MKDAHLLSSSLSSEMFIWPHILWPFLYHLLAVLFGQIFIKTQCIRRLKFPLTLP